MSNDTSGSAMEERKYWIEGAEHWERLANEAEEMAAWDRDHGIDLSTPGQSVGDRKAETYRCCARTLRLQAETGEPHCMCHERPTADCPNQERNKP